MNGTKQMTSSGSLEGTQKRTLYLRVGFVLSLLAAAAICGVVSYIVVDDLERNVGVQTYESIAVSALEGAQGITLRKLQGGEVMASMMSHGFPDAEDWPLISPGGYVETASKIAELSNSVSLGLIVMVEPDEAEAFEAHATQFYQDQNYPEGSGASNFGFGIWKRDPAKTYPDGRLPDTTGETNYESKYSILAPIFQHNIPNASSLMYNVHSNVFRGKAIDSMLDCAAASPSPYPDCSVVTDFVELIVNPGPAALIYGPIYAANDPDTIVGMTGASINWREVLTNVVPDYVDGLDCVVSTDTATFTYSINEGEPELKGVGDLHDRSYNHWGRSVVLNDIKTGAMASKTYTLTVYPTNPMLDEFRSNSPIAIALGFVGVILFCGAVFFSYDFFMRGESRQNKAILEMKRRFVRFVSHEIRTPLNTVCMGLELLRAELDSQLAAAEKGGKAKETFPSEGNDKSNNSQQSLFGYLMDLTGDILDNSESAVTILNDLLNYDKIETGTFQLEVGVVPIWDLVRKTVSSFDIQARKRRVALNFSMEGSQTNSGSNDVEQQKTPDFAMLNVVGDDMRLRQVILNLVSNALKFVNEEDGTIEVRASYHPEGLPGQHSLYTSKAGGEREAEPIAFPRDGSVRISVRDNGEGMTQEQLKLLFREGVQFDANKLQAGGGSGLGLYITKGLVEQHGGTISAQSDGRKCGTTFTIELPLYHCHSGAEPDHTSDSSAEAHGAVNPGATSLANAGNSPHKTSTCSPPKQNRHILVVDDAAMNRKMLIRLLERAGHSCDSAANGQEAVDAVLADQELSRTDEKHIPYDTILMDFEMPVMDGPAATAQIRGHGCTAFMVGVTGNVLLEDVNYFKSKGADLVLAKPLNLKSLDEAWRKHHR